MRCAGPGTLVIVDGMLHAVLQVLEWGSEVFSGSLWGFFPARLTAQVVRDESKCDVMIREVLGLVKLSYSQLERSSKMSRNGFFCPRKLVLRGHLVLRMPTKQTLWSIGAQMWVRPKTLRNMSSCVYLGTVCCSAFWQLILWMPVPPWLVICCYRLISIQVATTCIDSISNDVPARQDILVGQWEVLARSQTNPVYASLLLQCSLRYQPT